MFKLNSVKNHHRSLFGVFVAIIAILITPTEVSAQSVNCPNFWVNPKTGQTECLLIYNGALLRNPQQFLNKSKTVLVYGRLSCGWTEQMLTELNQIGIPYEFRDIDNEAISNEMWTMLRISGQDSSSLVNLPVISVNKQIMIRPDVTNVMAARK